MDEHNQKPNTLDTILAKIRANEIKIKPKARFRLKLAALIAVLALLVIVAVFFTSLVMFTIRASGQASLIGFGRSGVAVFLLLFPWKLSIIGIVLMLALEWLLRSFRFGYKIPTLYLLFGVLCIMLVSGLILDHFRFHDELMNLSGQHRLPPTFGRFYEGARRPPLPMGYGIYRAVIVSIGSSTLNAEVDLPGQASTTFFTIVMPSVREYGELTPGDRIFIRGQLLGSEIRTTGIRKMRPL